MRCVLTSNACRRRHPPCCSRFLIELNSFIRRLRERLSEDVCAGRCGTACAADEAADEAAADDEDAADLRAGAGAGAAATSRPRGMAGGDGASGGGGAARSFLPEPVFCSFAGGAESSDAEAQPRSSSHCSALSSESPQATTAWRTRASGKPIVLSSAMRPGALADAEGAERETM